MHGIHSFFSRMFSQDVSRAEAVDNPEPAEAEPAPAEQQHGWPTDDAFEAAPEENPVDLRGGGENYSNGSVTQDPEESGGGIGTETTTTIIKSGVPV